MQSGNWALNGQTITIADNGTLVDGQHRLMACVRAGVPFQTVVVYGADESAFETVDSGRRRSVSDVLKIKGYKHYTTLASVAQRVISGKVRGFESAFKEGRKPVSNNEILNFIENDKLVVSAANFVGGRHDSFTSLGVPSSVVGALFYMFAEASDCETARAFLTELADIAAPVKRSPVSAAQSALINFKARQKQTAHGNAAIVWVSAIVIKAWNKWVLGEDVARLQFQIGGANPEKFPAVERPLYVYE